MEQKEDVNLKRNTQKIDPTLSTDQQKKATGI